MVHEMDVALRHDEDQTFEKPNKISVGKWVLLLALFAAVIVLLTACPDMDEALPHYKAM